MTPIPLHLSSLPRTKSGLPVPYVAMWEGEEIQHIAHDKNINAKALFSSPRRPDGDAMLGFMEVSRQREVVALGLCQVCRKRLDPRDRFVVGLLESHADGTMIREPWTCTRCLVFALRVCPGLIRKQRSDDGLSVIRMSKWATLIAKTDVIGLVQQGLLDPAATDKPTVYGYAKIVPAESSYVMSSEQFLKSFG